MFLCSNLNAVSRAADAAAVHAISTDWPPLKTSLDSNFFDQTTARKPRSAAAVARSDAIEGLSLWRLWVTLGWNDILQRYRRSILGPFWLTASMAIMVIALGVLYAELFKTPVNDLLP